MIFGSICSGIEAASAAWLPLGWQCSFMSEIDAFPRAVLTHHYGDTKLHGDFTTIQEGEYEPIDVLVGGTPCQSFSVAGLRGGMADERGNLALEYLRLAERLRPRWLVWENVPGVLSSAGGRDFGSFVGGLGELGYGWAYRVLDAQYFGLAQRRKRVFVVGYLGDWRRAAAVLFEPASLRGNPAPSRATRERPPGAIGARTGLSVGVQDASAGHMISMSLNAHGGSGRMDGESETFVTHTLNAHRAGSVQEDGTGHGVPITVSHSLRADGFDASEDGTGRGTPLTWSIMPQNSGRDYKAREVDVAQPVMAGGPVGGNQGGDFIQTRSAVRRLTPRECERLQGFPDDFTLIPYRGKPAADGPRYRVLGNSMAVPVMRWIGHRIEMQSGTGLYD